jgi:hypothetical protein
MSPLQELILHLAVGLLIILAIPITLTLIAAGHEGRSKPYFKLIAVIGSVIIVLLDIYVVGPLLPPSTCLTFLVVVVPCLTFGAFLRHIAATHH